MLRYELMFRPLTSATAALCVLCLSPTLARGQTASEITPRRYEPALRPSLSPEPVLATPAQAAPTGAEKLEFKPKAVEVVGGLPSLAGATAAIVRPLAGATITAAQLFTAAHQIERAYAKAGYVLVRVSVPAQALKDGVVARLLVTDGAITRIDTQRLAPEVRERVSAALASLIGVHGLKYAVLERKVLLAGDTPGLVLTSTLAPGMEPGSSTLIVQGSYAPINIPITADNQMAANIGRTNLGAGLDLNSVFGFGELIYLRATGDPNAGANGYPSRRPRDRALAGGVVAPIGHDGWTLDLELAESAATPKPIEGALGVTSRFDRLSLRARYPLIRSRATNLSSEISFDVQRDALYGLLPNSIGLSLDRLRILRFALEASGLNRFGGAYSSRIVASFGTTLFNARTTAQATAELPLSRLGTDPEFQKLELDTSYHQPIRPHLVADFNLKGQMSFGEAMANAERFGIVGPQALSGFDLGAYQGDSGLAGRTELSSPWSVNLGPIGIGLAPYVFAATGMVHNEKPTAVERINTHLTSYGLGLHTTLFSGAIPGHETFTLEWARGELGDLGPSQTRVTLLATARF